MPQLRLKMKVIQCSFKDNQNILINIILYKINSFWRYFVLRNHSGTSLLLGIQATSWTLSQIRTTLDIFVGRNTYFQGQIYIREVNQSPSSLYYKPSCIHSETNQIIRFADDCQEPPLAVEGCEKDPTCRHNHSVSWRSRTLTPSYTSRP